MKLSRAEWAAAALCAAFLLFFGGWYLRGALSVGGTYTVSAQRAPAEVSPLPAESFLPDRRVDLNTATQADLEALPGIGAVRAADIIAYRAEHGPFQRPEDLTRVKGIGQAIYDGLADYITVEEAAP